MFCLSLATVLKKSCALKKCIFARPSVVSGNGLGHHVHMRQNMDPGQTGHHARHHNLNPARARSNACDSVKAVLLDTTADALLMVITRRWHVTVKLDRNLPLKQQQHQLNRSSQRQLPLRTNHRLSGLHGRNGAHVTDRVAMGNRPESERVKAVPLVPEIATPITGKK